MFHARGSVTAGNAASQYAKDQIADLPMRMIAAETTREKLTLRLHEELPYQLTVETEKWEYKPDGTTRIDQIVWECEQGRVDARTSHRELSAAVRAFIDDVSGATTSRMTLSDLGSRGPGLAPVTHVVLQLYPGEFGPDPARPIRPAAEAAKAVVAQWH